MENPTHHYQLLVIVVLLLSALKLQQQLLGMQLLSKSLTGEEIAHELVQVLSVSYAWHFFRSLIAAMWDRASVNGVVMKTVKIVNPN